MYRSGMLALLLFSSFGPSASAQLVNQNPTFDTDLAGWTEFTSTEGSVEWDPFDAGGSAMSGSAYLVVTDPDPGLCHGMLQRQIPIVGGVHHEMRLSGWIASNQPAPEVSLQMTVQYRSNGCTTFLPLGYFLEIEDRDQWIEQRRTLEVPEDADCASVIFSVCHEPFGGEANAYADNVYLLVSTIFQDDFESGDISAWSGLVP